MKIIAILIFAIIIAAATATPPASLRGADYCQLDGACSKCTSCMALSGKYCAKKSRSPKSSASFAIISGPYCLDPSSNNQICDEGEPLESCESLEGLSTIVMPGMKLPAARLFRL
jgi:hypothetical protein